MINIITYKGEKYQQIEIFDNSICNMCSVCDVKDFCSEVNPVFYCVSGKVFKKLSNLRKQKINKILND